MFTIHFISVRCSCAESFLRGAMSLSPWISAWHVVVGFVFHTMGREERLASFRRAHARGDGEKAEIAEVKTLYSDMR
jgi:hypothetical protein